MVARIVYSPALGQLKVSRPTFDVNTATRDQLAFESVGDPYAGVYLSGETQPSDPGWVVGTFNSNTFGVSSFSRAYRVIPLGKTFAAPPQVIWTLRDAVSPASGDYAKYGFLNLTAYFGALGYEGMVCWASCTTTDLILRIDYTTGYAGNLAWRFSYMVFQT